MIRLLAYVLLGFFIIVFPVFSADKMYRTHTAPDGSRVTIESAVGFVPAPSQITPSTTPYDSYTPDGLLKLLRTYANEENYSGVINVSEYLRYKRRYCTDETMAMEIKAAYHRGGQEKAMRHLNDIKKHKSENRLMNHLLRRVNLGTFSSFDIESWDLYKEGKQKMKVGNYKGALISFQKATEIDPKNSDAWLGIASTKGKLAPGSKLDKFKAETDQLRILYNQTQLVELKYSYESNLRYLKSLD